MLLTPIINKKLFIMPNQKRFPAADSDFNTYANNANTYLNVAGNKSRLVLTSAATTALTTLNSLITTATTGWNAIFPQSQNPATDTTTITAAKNTLRDSIETQLRIIFADIPNSVLTQTDRDTLNLTQHSDTHTPVPKPQNAPVIVVTGRDHLSVTLNITDPAHPQVQAKPDGVSEIEIQSAFLAPGATPAAGFPNETDFRHLALSGRASFERDYTQDQLKGTDYIRARYISTRKEPGAWSEIISVVVS
jgi:hypothetical protein